MFFTMLGLLDVVAAIVAMYAIQSGIPMTLANGLLILVLILYHIITLYTVHQDVLDCAFDNFFTVKPAGQ